MGLQDITPDSGSSSSSSSGSSSSGSSSDGRHAGTTRQTLSGVSPDDFPVGVVKTPYLIVRETDTGYESIFYPETPQVEVTYEWYGKFSYDRRADEERIVWDRDTFELLERRVEQSQGANLRQAMKDEPERGLRLIRMAANIKIEQRYTTTESCPVCGSAIDARHHEYETVGQRRVCTDHPVEDLSHAGLL